MLKLPTLRVSENCASLHELVFERIMICAATVPLSKLYTLLKGALAALLPLFLCPWITKCSYELQRTERSKFRDELVYDPHMQFLAARSRWTNLCCARYSIPL